MRDAGRGIAGWEPGAVAEGCPHFLKRARGVRITLNLLANRGERGPSLTTLSCALD